ncbi:hypothetical protein BJV78DRAFT_1358066 [Lactifluus subvellereus]|nr:hypothetical protein BJV78DRAFT_1358066 [Lactifluus subvellereus]
MRTMLSSVTRIFRRPFLAAPPRKSRHELVSEAHIAYMQEHRRCKEEKLEQRRQRRLRLSSSASCSSLSTLSSISSMDSDVSTSSKREEESPYESLCHALRRTEKSLGRFLHGPYSYI